MTGDVRFVGPLEAAGPEAVELAAACEPQEDRQWFEKVLNSDFVEQRQVVLAYDGEAIVGFGLTGHPHPMPADWRILRVLVAPTLRGHGLGGELHARVRTLAPSAGVTLRSSAYDTDPRDLEIARHWGFESVQLSYTSTCALDALPPAPPLPAGVSIEPTRDLHFPDEEEVEAMYDRSQTNPERAQFVGDLPFLRAFGVGPDGLGALLRVDGRPAALTWAMFTPPRAHVIYTGVDPAFRGRGYGALLKDRLHRLAGEAGAEVCTTNNEEHNAGIRHVNAELGYVVSHGEHWLQQRI